MTSARSLIKDSEAILERPSLLATLGLAPMADGMSPAWAVQGLRTSADAWPLFIAVQLCVMIGGVKPASLADLDGFIPFAALAVALLFSIGLWLLTAHRLSARLQPHYRMWIVCALSFGAALASGLWFSLLPKAVVDGLFTPFAGQIVLALVALSLFGQQRAPGFTYCLGLVLCMVSLHTPGRDVLLGVMLFALGASMLVQARGERERHCAQEAEALRSQRAQRLLTDYEESGRGWFWETERTGAITYISPTLARSLEDQPESLIGKKLADLVNMGAADEHEGKRTLGFHLSSRSAFNDVAVRAATRGDERWWALSGRPIVNEYGQFQGFRGSGSDLTEMKRSQAEVTRLAEFDSLTGLANRVQMQRALEQALVDSRGKAGECALFLLDLDRFKNVNDTMGHPAGDALLREVSRRLKHVVGDRGMVGRLGGDEFKVVLPGRWDRPKLGVLADAIIATLSQPYHIEEAQVVIGASVGIALCPDDATSRDALVRNADLALYAAKDAGRGVHRFYSSDMHAEAEDRRQLEDDLRTALADGGLELVYQPLVGAKNGKIVGFETLLRWNHPARGPVSPALFVPIAEDAGLIGPLGEWVLRTACAVAAQWPSSIRIAVNVSPIQFSNPAFPGSVMNALASSALAPQRLELEITESCFINEGEKTDQMFAQLKAIGVRLALDDFGTGYSSLGYLRKAPFDKIKIDQSFVRGAAMRGNRNAAIITSIVSLAEALGMDTTAEGVETHDELELIRALGVSQVQGYIYGKGSTADEVKLRFAEQGVEARPTGFKSSRPARISMLRSVAIHHQGQRYVGRVRNISAGGAMIEGLWNVPPETSFQIDLAEGMSIDAITRWSVDDRMGVQFAQAIDVRQVQSGSPVRLAG
ncbi:MAG: EAL domain-containing protein [Sphingomonadaceae bacterium]|nr:EAL domain-containing protein [Sphingomonadaceae bacterium]